MYIQGLKQCGRAHSECAIALITLLLSGSNRLLSASTTPKKERTSYAIDITSETGLQCDSALWRTDSAPLKCLKQLRKRLNSAIMRGYKSF